MILVTGASGFVGSAVARQSGAGRSNRCACWCAPTSSRVNLADPRLEIVEGDLLDAGSIERAMKDVRVLFHVAADYRLWARNPDDIVRTNVDGTRIADESGAARRRRAHRLYVRASPRSRRGRTAHRATRHFRSTRSPPSAPTNTARSSPNAWSNSMVAEQNLPAVIVNPSTPIGPGDVRPTPTGRIIVEAAAGRMPGFVDTGLNLVHVDDVAAGHIAAWQKGRIGERYILGGQDVLLGDMLREIARFVGRAPPQAAHAAAADLSDRLWRRSDRAFHRPRAVRDHDRTAARQGSHVLHVGQGRARTRLSRAALRRSDRRRHHLVPAERLSQNAEKLTAPSRRRSRRKWKNSTPSRRRRTSMSRLVSISPTISAILDGRK